MNMQQKVVVITGASSGIGAVAATELARAGARIICIGRDPARGAKIVEQLRAITPGVNHLLYCADLARLSEVKRVGNLLAESEQRIDVLINNAGALFARRELTEDGLEKTFATNHIAYFVLTNLLLERLKVTAGARIVSTASDAHKSAKIDFADLQSENGYSAFGAYGRSKLMNILFTRTLARRLAGSGATSNCFHPGFVATRFGDANGGFMAFIIRSAKKFALTPEEGAKTMIYLASSPEAASVSGKYFYKCKVAIPSEAARNDADAQRLWDISARLSGVGA